MPQLFPFALGWKIELDRSVCLTATFIRGQMGRRMTGWLGLVPEYHRTELG
jgi:hypothetical protein